MSNVLIKGSVSGKVEDYLNVRKGAGTNNKIAGTLTKGDILEIYTFNMKVVDGKQWVKVKLSDGSLGWVLKEFVESKSKGNNNECAGR